MRARFEEVLPGFLDEASKKGSPGNPNWCEIAYINQVTAADENGLIPLASVLRLVHDVPLERLPPPEDSSFAQRHVLTRAGAPIGRFYITATAALKLSPGKPLPQAIYIINLTVRGLAEGQSKENIMNFMDYGRELIVHAFRDVTTEEMHSQWGLK